MADRSHRRVRSGHGGRLFRWRSIRRRALRVLLFLFVVLAGAVLIDFLFMLEGYDPVLWNPKDVEPGSMP